MSSIKIRGTVNNCWGIDRYCIYSADTFHLFVEKTGLHWLLVLVTSLSKILLIIDKLDLAGSSSAYLMSEVIFFKNINKLYMFWVSKPWVGNHDTEKNSCLQV